MDVYQWIWCLIIFAASLALNTHAGELEGGATNSPSAGVSFAYFAHSDRGDHKGSDDISGYVLNEAAGTVTQINCGGDAACRGANFLAGTGRGHRTLTVEPGGKFAYVENGDGNDISAYAINSTTGTLMRIDCGGGKGCNGANFAAGSSPWSVTVHPNGRFVYVANWGGSVSAYIINTNTGALTAINCNSGATCEKGHFAAGNSPQSVTIDTTGRFAYVANYYGKDVTAYTINPKTGVLTPIDCGGGAGCNGANFASGENPKPAVIHPTGKFLYVSGSKDISAYTINPASGALTLINCGNGVGCNGVNFMIQEHPPQQITIDPSGKFAYLANYNNDVSAFAINAMSGALKQIDCGGGTGCNGANFAAGRSPRPVTVHPSGKFAYVTDAWKGELTAYTIDVKTGALARSDCMGDTGCNGGNFVVGETPDAAAIDPSGRFVYVANWDSNDLTVFTVNASTGALTRVICSGGPAECNGVNFGGSPVKKRFAAAERAFEEGRFAKSAIDYQWVVDQKVEGSHLNEARYRLGYMYEIGLGVARDMEKADLLYRKSTWNEKYGHDRVVLLSDFESAGFPKWLRAFRRMHERAAQGSHPDEYTLGYLYLYGLGVREDAASAALWLKRATVAENPHALYLLGVMSAKGIGAKASTAEAKALFTRAAELGSREAAAALRSAKPALPKPFRQMSAHAARCAKIADPRQAGFPKQGQAEDFEDFRERLREDFLSVITKKGGLANTDASSFSNSIDDGVKGKAVVKEIAALSNEERFIYPLWFMLQDIFTTTCPVGYGGHFSDDLGNKVEVWYVSFGPDDQENRTVFKNPHLPVYGKIERNVFPVFVFKRDEKGRLMWYAFSSEMMSLFNHWHGIQLR